MGETPNIDLTNTIILIIGSPKMVFLIWGKAPNREYAGCKGFMADWPQVTTVSCFGMYRLVLLIARSDSWTFADIALAEVT